ncbi:TlpA family protein disulfide reductase [Chryseobacterium sp.]|uniref:TlpA family protein disulfide reductase n=1 Tax=Chryseobacterium sp. TaxID=1871047 RepID=UPI00388F5A83
MKSFWIVIMLLIVGGNMQAQNLEVGDKVPEITALTISGQDFKLSEVKKEYILLDFWASWCAPCVEEQPELMKIYSEFSEQVKNNKFDIIGISLDKSKENWTKVVDKNKIEWTQVSDLKFWKSPIAKAYFINELPYNLIINKEGKVVAKNLHGEELENFLKNLLK